MSLEDWERRVLADPDATERVDNIEQELRAAVRLTALPGDRLERARRPTPPTDES